MASLVDRMLRASKLDVNLYEEVEADKGAMGQAVAVVVIASVASGIGVIAYTGISGLIMGTIFALISWFIWAYIIFVVGTKLLPEPQTKSDVGELLRTIAFANSPGVLRILGFIPLIGGIVMLITGIWILVATVIAVRQALDYKSTWRAVGVCIIAAIVVMIISWLVFSVLGMPNPFVPNVS